MEDFLDNIDWLRLRDQKRSLLQCIAFFEVSDEAFLAEDLTGILHLIDAIQDEADRLGIMPEDGWLTEEE